jgi:hypothetical protein
MKQRLEHIKESLTGSFNLDYFLQLTDLLTELVTKEMVHLKMVKIQ